MAILADSITISKTQRNKNVKNATFHITLSPFSVKSTHTFITNSDKKNRTIPTTKIRINVNAIFVCSAAFSQIFVFSFKGVFSFFILNFPFFKHLHFFVSQILEYFYNATPNLPNETKFFIYNNFNTIYLLYENSLF